jgi:hypothetical protein
MIVLVLSLAVGFRSRANLFGEIVLCVPEWPVHR